MTSSTNAMLHDPDIAEMLEQLQVWHAKRIGQLQSLIDAKDDVDIVLRGVDDQQVKITGDARKGFKSAMRIAVDLFSPFPLRTEMVEANDDQEEE